MPCALWVCTTSRIVVHIYPQHKNPNKIYMCVSLCLGQWAIRLVLLGLCSTWDAGGLLIAGNWGVAPAPAVCEPGRTWLLSHDIS